MGNGDGPMHPLLRDLGIGNKKDEGLAAELARRAAAKKAKGQQPRRVIDPRTLDTASMNIPIVVLNTMLEMLKLNPDWLDARIAEAYDKMDELERTKFECLVEGESAASWLLISLVARKGNRVRAFQIAQRRFRAESFLKNGDAKAACVHWADTLGIPAVMLLESGDFEKPGEVAYRLMQVAKAKAQKSVRQMGKDFDKVRLVPVAPLHAVVTTDAQLGTSPVTALPPRADDAPAPSAEAPKAKAVEEPKPKKAKAPRKPRAKEVKEEAPKPPPEPEAPAAAEEPAAPPPEPEPTVVVEPEPQPEPEPPVAEAPKAEVNEPTEHKAVIVSLPSKEERIMAKAKELAKAAGWDFSKAGDGVRKHYIRLAKQKLGL